MSRKGCFPDKEEFFPHYQHKNLVDYRVVFFIQKQALSENPERAFAMERPGRFEHLIAACVCAI